MATLLALSVGPDIPVDRGSVMVGRHPQCDVRLDSPRVSRRHCILTFEGPDVVVRDLGSTNGIIINGVKVTEGRLHPGDELVIGNFRYQVCGDLFPKPVARKEED